MNSRGGFTVIELLIVIIIAGIVAGTALPRVGQAVAVYRLDRATSVVRADLQLAATMAARQRRPVEVLVDESARRMVVRDAGNTSVRFSERHLGDGSEFNVRYVTAAPSTVKINPAGLNSDTIAIVLRSAGEKRTVRMSRAGQVRVHK